MKEGDKKRIKGLIDLLFYLLEEDASDEIILVAYKHFIEAEPIEEFRINLIYQQLSNKNIANKQAAMKKILAIDSIIGLNKKLTKS